MTRLPRAAAGFPMLPLLALSSACGIPSPLPGGAESVPPISVDRIMDRPEEFMGDRIRLAAAVAEPHGNRIFTLRDEDPVMREQILVVTRRPLPRLLAEERTTLQRGDKLLVSGIVRRCDVAEVEGELGVDLDPKLEERFRGKPMLVASEVVRTGGNGADAPDTLTPP
ncbi:MAG: hypothetical protein ACREOF_18730 [Gemmatimonadales bacterium]